MTSKKNAPQFKYCNVSEATQRTRSFWVLPQLRSCSPDSLSLVPPEARSPGASPCSEPLTTAVRGPAPARLTRASLWAQLRPPHPRGGGRRTCPSLPQHTGHGGSRALGGPQVPGQAPLGSRRKKPTLRHGENEPAAFVRSGRGPRGAAPGQRPGEGSQDGPPAQGRLAGGSRGAPRPDAPRAWRPRACQGNSPTRTPASSPPGHPRDVLSIPRPCFPARGRPGAFSVSHAPTSSSSGCPGASLASHGPPFPARGVPGGSQGGLNFAAPRLKPLQASGTRGAGLQGGVGGARGPERGTLILATALGGGTLGQGIGSKCVLRARPAIYPIPPKADAAGTEVLEKHSSSRGGARRAGTQPPGTPTAEVGGRSRQSPASEGLRTPRQSHRRDSSRSNSCKHRLGRCSETPGRPAHSLGVSAGGSTGRPLPTAGHPGLSARTGRVHRVPCPLL